MRFFYLLFFILIHAISLSQEDNALPYVREIPPWDTPASFPGGSDSLFKFIRLNTELKLNSSSKHYTMHILTAFTVARNGKLKNIRIVNGIPGQPELANEALRLLEICPEWNPAKKGKRKVESDHTLAIPFSK